MMRKKFILLGVISTLFCVSVYAQTFEEKRTIYPVVVNEGQRVINGFQLFNGQTDERVFANAMKWAINEFCNDKRDQMFDIQVNKKTFSVNMQLEYTAAGKVKYVFNNKANVKVIDGKLVYTFYDITYKTNSILPFSSVSSIDKLNPEKKPKHKEIISAFEELASKKINLMFDAVVGNHCAEITHWDDINIQRAIKGMNEDECFLAFGKPSNSYEDNHYRIQWSYGLNFVLIFKEGKVETIIR